MSATNRNLSPTQERRLHAYHDGQLGPIARWWFGRSLARSPQLRTRLDELDEIGGWLREVDTPPSPDLWDHIALRLPAIDAQRAEAGSSSHVRDPSLGRIDRWLGLRPVAAAATAAVAVAIALGTIGDGADPRSGAVRWLDTGGRSVMVLDDPETATIVWLLESTEEGA